MFSQTEFQKLGRQTTLWSRRLTSVGQRPGLRHLGVIVEPGERVVATKLLVLLNEPLKLGSVPHFENLLRYTGDTLQKPFTDTLTMR